MRLNTKSRYAVMALADMASFSENKPISLRDISLRQSISLQYLEQIFQKLKKSNIVKNNTLFLFTNYIVQFALKLSN